MAILVRYGLKSRVAGEACPTPTVAPSAGTDRPVTGSYAGRRLRGVSRNENRP